MCGGIYVCIMYYVWSPEVGRCPRPEKAKKEKSPCPRFRKAGRHQAGRRMERTARVGRVHLVHAESLHTQLPIAFSFSKLLSLAPAFAVAFYRLLCFSRLFSFCFDHHRLVFFFFCRAPLFIYFSSSFFFSPFFLLPSLFSLILAPSLKNPMAYSSLHRQSMVFVRHRLNKSGCTMPCCISTAGSIESQRVSAAVGSP